MGRYGIDYESVCEVADKLVAEGQAATVERVRATLGTGSYTTLGRHLRLWRRQHGPTEPGAQAMPEMINDAAQAVWANLNRAAEERIEQAQLAAQTAVATAVADAEAQVEAMHLELGAQATAHDLAMRHSEEARDAQAAAVARSEAQQAATEADRIALKEEVAAAQATVQQLGARLVQAQAITTQHEQTIALLLSQAQAVAQAQSDALAKLAKDNHQAQTDLQQQISVLTTSWQESQMALSGQLQHQSDGLDRLKVVPIALAAISEAVAQSEASGAKNEVATQALAQLLQKIDNRLLLVEASLHKQLPALANIAQATAPATLEAHASKQHRTLQNELEALRKQLISHWGDLRSQN